MKKISMRVVLEKNITYDLEGSLDSAILYLQEIKTRYSDIYKDISISIDIEYDYYNSKSIVSSVYGYREETDEEYKERVGREYRYKENNEKKEKDLLKDLIKKYGYPKDKE